MVCCSIAGGIQLIILGMQFKYSADAESLQIDGFDGLQFPEDRDLYVHERHSYTLQDDPTSENERTAPLVEAEPILQAAEPPMRIPPSGDPVPIAVNSGNLDYPIAPTSGEAGRFGTDVRGSRQPSG